VESEFPLRLYAINLSNRHSRTADNVWSSRLKFGGEATIFAPYKHDKLRNGTHWFGPGQKIY